MFSEAESSYIAFQNVVHFYFRRYHWFRVKDQDDLLQAGRLGLWEAVMTHEFSQLDVKEQFSFCCKAIGREMGRVARYRRRSSSTADVEQTADRNALNPLAACIAKEDEAKHRCQRERLHSAVEKLPAHRQDLLQRFADGRVSIQDRANPQDVSVSSTLLRVVAYLQDETTRPGTGDLVAAVELPKRKQQASSQLAMVADKVRGIYDEEAVERKSEGGKSAGNGRKKVVENLPQPKSTGDKARDKAAATVGVPAKLDARLRNRILELWDRFYTVAEIVADLNVTANDVHDAKAERRTARQTVEVAIER